MKKASVNGATTMAEMVILHAQWQKSRKRRPSMSYKGINNPQKALLLALTDNGPRQYKHLHAELAERFQRNGLIGIQTHPAITEVFEGQAYFDSSVGSWEPTDGRLVHFGVVISGHKEPRISTTNYETISISPSIGDAVAKELAGGKSGLLKTLAHVILAKIAIPKQAPWQSPWIIIQVG